ncbi:hypothetical protein KAW80_04570 [Candidatus Babeliales bacterium]|nr:hypothetical protein [Candidatus Babeliales bacterium]
MYVRESICLNYPEEHPKVERKKVWLSVRPQNENTPPIPLRLYLGTDHQIAHYLMFLDPDQHASENGLYFKLITHKFDVQVLITSSSVETALGSSVKGIIHETVEAFFSEDNGFFAECL